MQGEPAVGGARKQPQEPGSIHSANCEKKLAGDLWTRACGTLSSIHGRVDGSVDSKADPPPSPHSVSRVRQGQQPLFCFDLLI